MSKPYLQKKRRGTIKPIVLYSWNDETITLVIKNKTLYYLGGARGVVAIVVGNGHGDTSSNPGRD